MIKGILSFLLCSIGFMLPSLVFAADLNFINVKLSPQTPGVNQDVTVSLESFGVDLGASEIIWYVDKDPIKQGVGERSVIVHTGDFGTSVNIDVVIISDLGKKIEKKITIVPAEIDFLWEARTYTPPFYKGKALPTYKSLVKVTAIPRYGQYSSDPKDFTYDWKYNRTLSVGGGLGRNSATVQMGYANTQVPVSVDIGLPNTPDWKGVYSGSIRGVDAAVRFYEQAPLLGTNFRSIVSGGANGEGNQYTLKAVPYFFSSEDLATNALVYTWTVNGRNSVPGLDPTVLTVTKAGEGEEKFDVSLKIQTPKHLLQEGQTRAVITLPADEQ